MRGGLVGAATRRRSCWFDLVECLLGADFGSEPPIMPVEQLTRVHSRLLCMQVCLLAVGTRNLAWMRTALASGDGWSVPVVVVADALRGEAIADLIRLGVQNFVHVDGSADDLWVRRAAGRGPGAELRISPDFGHRQGQFGRPGPAYGTTLPSELVLQRTFGCSPDDGFGAAKARVIAGFERAYLHAALQRHRGNIARAVPACDKQWRASGGWCTNTAWMLMPTARIPPACRSPRARGVRPQAVKCQVISLPKECCACSQLEKRCVLACAAA